MVSKLYNRFLATEQIHFLNSDIFTIENFKVNIQKCYFVRIIIIFSIGLERWGPSRLGEPRILRGPQNFYFNIL